MLFNLETNVPDSSKLFFGETQGIVRHDLEPRFIQKSIEQQTAKRWQPKDVPLKQDQIDYYTKLSDSERWIYDKNLQYQMVLDSAAGRGHILSFLPIVSHPGLNTLLVRWADFEEVHNQAYSWMQDNVYTDPNYIRNTILDDEFLKACAKSVVEHYDNLIYMNAMYLLKEQGNDYAKREWNLYEHKRLLMRNLVSVNAFEAMRFQTSFACTFSFGKRGLMVGSKDEVSYIAKDEMLHVQLTRAIINHLRTSEEDYNKIFIEDEVVLKDIVFGAAMEEKERVKHLFSRGSIYGFSENTAIKFIDFLLGNICSAYGWKEHSRIDNPIPWYYEMIYQQNARGALMEKETVEYQKGSLNMYVDINKFSDLSKQFVMV